MGLTTSWESETDAGLPSVEAWPRCSAGFGGGEQTQVKDEEGAGSLCWSQPAVDRGWPCASLGLGDREKRM